MNIFLKRLIEVDLPIKKISEYARSEKNIRSGHPWHLHIWWARRPWGACRAITLASLLPSPSDKLCPDVFVYEASKILAKFGFCKDNKRETVEKGLLKFVGEFSEWEKGNQPIWLNAARELINVAYPSSPCVFDPFSGYGAIPGEAARLGCDAIASDLNPVALLCLRTLLEALPKYGERLIDEFQKGVDFIKQEAEKRLAPFYNKKNNKKIIAWLWARTVTCEGPACGATIPLISQTNISMGKIKTWIKITGDIKTKAIDVEVCSGKTAPSGLIKTAGGGHAVCPVCGYTTNKEQVKKQGKNGHIGNLLYGVAVRLGSRQGKEYLTASLEDKRAFDLAEKSWNEIILKNPKMEIDEQFVLTYGLHVPPHYGIKSWGDLFSPRQKLAYWTLCEILHNYEAKLNEKISDATLIRDVITALALAISNCLHYSTNMSTWLAEHMISCFITGNAIAMRWDWAEANPLVPEYVGGIDYAFKQAEGALIGTTTLANAKTSVLQADAANFPLPDDMANMFFSDPPYYDVVPYADLSDLCFVWLKRFLGHLHPDLLNKVLTPKAEQIVVNPYNVSDGRGEQSSKKYQERMTKAFSEARRVLRPDGIGCIVFAHKGTEAWETLLESIIDAGFIVTGSWPIDTERAARMRANKSATLSSSVHIVCRPRENNDGTVINDEVGDWRDVLTELPIRIHEWMPKMADEGVVGADAIFACLGPALEIFSRYSKVEKSSGETVTLKEYLEQVWAAVAKEALTMIFTGADASGFEEDARITAMWLWTLKTDENDDGKSEEDYVSSEHDEGSGGIGKKSSKGGFSLEYDAARKIAQGLGVHLENLEHLLTIQGDTAILLPVDARTRYLFGNNAEASPQIKSKSKNRQMKLDFNEELKQIEEQSGGWIGDLKGKAGSTVLDQLHQSMILFAAGRSEALKRFLVEEGIGRNPLFWRLAQALSALYPTGTDEKRWVDGLLARKKGLGF